MSDGSVVVRSVEGGYELSCFEGVEEEVLTGGSDDEFSWVRGEVL